jgi:hypothetical protein
MKIVNIKIFKSMLIKRLIDNKIIKITKKKKNININIIIY